MHIHILFIALYNLCSFVCLEFIVPLENFSLIWRRHHYRWVATKFDLCSVLMAIKQWGFFSVTHLLLWHGASVYDGHLQGPLTHLHRRAFRSAAVTTCFNDYGISRLGFEHPTLILWGLTHRDTPAVSVMYVQHFLLHLLQISLLKNWYDGAV